MGDFNAKMGKLKNSKPGCGKFGLGDQLLIQLLNIIPVIFIHGLLWIAKYGAELIIQ